MPKICLVVYRATAGGAVLAVLLSSFQDVLQDGRKKSLFLLQSEDDMILLDRSTRAVLIFLFVWVVSLSHTLVIELSSSRFCFHNSENDSSATTVPRLARMFWQVMTASRCSFATPVPWRHRACLVPLQDVSTRFRYFLVR